MKGAILNEQVNSIKRDNRRKIQSVRRSRDVKVLKRTTGNFIDIELEQTQFYERHEKIET